MGCDEGFGQLENMYSNTKHLHEPHDFSAAASKLRNAVVIPLCAENMLDLKEIAQDYFKHNKAKHCLFSKCKRVFLSKKYPFEMLLQYYDKVTGRFDTESVLLAVEESDISKLKTTQEFQTYYLKHSGKTATEVQQLLPILQETKFKAILPKKFQDGQVMFITREKLADIDHLKRFTLGNAPKWIEGVIARQHEPNLRPKANQRKADDRIYFHIENMDDELDLDIDTESATVMNEYYEGEPTDGGEEIEPVVPETGKKSQKRKGSKGKKQDVPQTKKKSPKEKASKGTKKHDTGNIIIKLFITIRTNNPITHFS